MNLKQADMQFLSFFIEEGIYIFPKVVNKSENETLTNIPNEASIEKTEKNIEVAEKKPVKTESKEVINDISANTISVVIYEERDDTIVVKEKLFLDNILKYFKINPDSVSIINLHIEKNESSFTDVLENSNINKAIAFGIPEKFLTDKTELYQLNQHNEIQFVVCPSLTQIAQSKNEKLRLWNVLKLLFNS